MATTVKRITLALTKEDILELENLKKLFGDSISQILKRALWTLHEKHFPNIKSREAIE